MSFLNRNRSFVVLIWFVGFFGFLYVATPSDSREKILAAMGEMLPPLIVLGFFMVGTATVVMWASREPESEDANSPRNGVD